MLRREAAHCGATRLIDDIGQKPDRRLQRNRSKDGFVFLRSTAYAAVLFSFGACQRGAPGVQRLARGTSLMKKAFCTTAVLIAGLLAVPTHADNLNGVTLTVTPVGTIVQGRNADTEVTLLNNSGGPITVIRPGPELVTSDFVSGDPTDVPTDFTFLVMHGCAALVNPVLADGSECSHSFSIDTSKDTENDHDSGLSLVTVSISYTVPGSTEIFTASDSTLVTVEDPLTPVPEPLSSLFFGTGLLGLLGTAFFRKRFS